MNNTELMNRLKQITKGYFEYHWNPYYAYPGILKLLIQRVINLIYQFSFLPESFGITSGCDKICNCECGFVSYSLLL